MTKYDPTKVKKRYGRLPPSEEDAIAYMKAVKLVVGADGDIAKDEYRAMQKGLDSLGVSKDAVDEIKAFDYKNAKLEDVLPKMKKGGLRARMLLRDAIEISSADGHYAAEEKAAVDKAAQLLGVDAMTRASIEALVELERGARHLRKALFPKKK